MLRCAARPSRWHSRCRAETQASIGRPGFALRRVTGVESACTPTCLALRIAMVAWWQTRGWPRRVKASFVHAMLHWSPWRLGRPSLPRPPTGLIMPALVTPALCPKSQYAYFLNSMKALRAKCSHTRGQKPRRRGPAGQVNNEPQQCLLCCQKWQSLQKKLLKQQKRWFKQKFGKTHRLALVSGGQGRTGVRVRHRLSFAFVDCGEPHGCSSLRPLCDPHFPQSSANSTGILGNGVMEYAQQWSSATLGSVHMHSHGPPIWHTAGGHQCCLD